METEEVHADSGQNGTRVEESKRRKRVKETDGLKNKKQKVDTPVKKKLVVNYL